MCPGKFILGQAEASSRSPCPEVAFASDNKSPGGTAQRDSQQQRPWLVVGTALQMDALVGSKGNAELMKRDQAVTLEAKPCEGGTRLLSPEPSLPLQAAGGGGGGVTQPTFITSPPPPAMGPIW